MELRVSLRRPGQEEKNAIKIKNDDKRKARGKTHFSGACQKVGPLTKFSKVGMDQFFFTNC